VRWESYRRCLPTEVPSHVRWVESEFSPRGYVVWYGGTTAEHKGWGAPFRRIVHEAKRTIVYYRLTRGLKAPREKREAT
jgi:hypothetical protein